MIAFENKDYPIQVFNKGKTPKKGRELKITDLLNNKEYYFHSLREYDLDSVIRPKLSNRRIIAEIAKGIRPQIENYHIEFIN